MKKKLPLVLILVAFVAVVSLNLARTTFSVQKRSTFAAVESSPILASALGTPVEIGWPRGKGFERFSTRNGGDNIFFRYPVTGPKGEAELSGSVQNINDQGWAGEFKVETVSTSTLVDGKYVSSSPRVLAVGSYSLEGVAQPMRLPD